MSNSTPAPTIGIGLFSLLYAVATRYYPGGSQVAKNSVGFSWIQNYWCNLLNETALNGQPNQARPTALTAMFVLAVALALFWWRFPRQAGLSVVGGWVVRISGVVSMVLGLFIFTDFHDVLITVASICGLVAVVGTFVGLQKLGWQDLIALGIVNLLLVALNNLLYYGDLRFYLPVVQKITFLLFLLWITLIDLRFFKKVRPQHFA